MYNERDGQESAPKGERIMRMVNKVKGKPNPIYDSLRHMVASVAERLPDKALYIYTEGKEEKTYTYKQYNQDMNALGCAFDSLGLTGGHRVAVIGETHPYYTMTYIATVSGNNVIIPLDKELDKEQILNFIRLSQADVVVHSEKFNEFFLQAADTIPHVKYIISMKPTADTTEKHLSFEALLELGRSMMAEGNNNFSNRELDMKSMAAILFTSGTTGTSKGVMLSHGNMIAALNASVQSMPMDDNNTFVSVLPVHHTYEMTCGQLGVMAIGGTQFINDSLKRVLRNFAAFKPNTLVLVPLFLETMHRRIWEEIRRQGMEKKVRTAMKLNAALLSVGIDIREKLFGRITAAFGGNLKCIVSGGAPLNPEIIKDFYHFGIAIFEGYGITECAPLISVNRPGKVHLHSVGTPVQGVTVKIDMTPGEETGEILAKGPNIMLGYYNNEEATAEVFTEDGYFRTGDIGFIDEDGCIHITGRKKNIILLSNGKNIFPEELEEHLQTIPGLLETVVIGRTKKAEDGTESIVITALIVPNKEHEAVKDLDEEALSSYFKTKVTEINKTMPLYKRIADVEIRHEEFEKNTSKKIKRFLIK